MKGKGAFYFALPQVAKVRSRLVEPPKELSNDIRKELATAAVAALNSANLSIRAHMVNYFAGRTDLVFKSEAHKTQVLGLMSGFFDSVFTVTKEDLEKLVGDGDEDEVTPADVVVDETAATEEVIADATAPAEITEDAVTPVAQEEVIEAAPEAKATKGAKQAKETEEFE